MPLTKTLSHRLLPSRRGFLALSTGALVQLTTPAKLLAQRSRESIFTDSNSVAYSEGTLSEASFRKLIGTRFWLELPEGGPVMLSLLSVTPRKPQVLTHQQTSDITGRLGTPYSQTRRLTSFVAVFHTEGRQFPQDSYVLDSPFLGRFVLFLAPGSDGMYSAVITRFDVLPAQ
ncbi:MAG: DUF6916 family protein [Janthinobacterium lividum]